MPRAKYALAFPFYIIKERENVWLLTHVDAKRWYTSRISAEVMGVGMILYDYDQTLSSTRRLRFTVHPLR